MSYSSGVDERVSFKKVSCSVEVYTACMNNVTQQTFKACAINYTAPKGERNLDITVDCSQSPNGPGGMDGKVLFLYFFKVITGRNRQGNFSFL